jgi:CRP/FNR family transcriptional regulator, anaerobic regulatory protein
MKPTGRRGPTSKKYATVATSANERSCRRCASYGLCHPAEDAGTSLARHRRALKKGDHLFRIGDPFHAIYVIQSGCIKTSMLTGGGEVQVLRFSLPGELVGINAIGNSHYPSDAEALEPTELCELPFAQLEKLAREYPQVQHRLLRLLSEEIVMDEKLMAMLGHQKAETRVANCLLNFRQRYQQQGSTDLSFRLPMSRQDMGDYLGLSLETISRLLSRFQAEGLLRVQGRQVHLLDLLRLQSVAEHCPEPAVVRA